MIDKKNCIFLILLIGLASGYASSPCDVIRCAGNHVCKEIKKVSCNSDGCDTKLTAACIPNIKRGTCPMQNLTEESESNCEVDSDCEGNLKCCPHKNKSYCFKPCRKMFCKCQASYKVVYAKNSKGCDICSCQKKDNSQNDDIDVCSLPVEIGLCKASLSRYFYDSKLGKCINFNYGGCQGNGNNFFTKKACEYKCAPKKTEEKAISKCELKPEVGMCRGIIPRYFYNITVNQCQEFSYGGCRGNENNFETKDACLKECSKQNNTTIKQFDDRICGLDFDSGPCYAYFERFYFNKRSKKCEKFVYGGCFGNENRFRTEEECEKSCLRRQVQEFKNDKQQCSMKKDPGPCLAYIEMYYFNSETKKCEQFIYGGCDGNGNRFQTKEECENSCFSLTLNPATFVKAPVDIKICKLKKEPGPCFGYFEMFHYNVYTKRCEKFVYGGCQGNENRFPTEQDCLNSCQHMTNEEALLPATVNKKFDEKNCLLPMKQGPCQAFVPSFFYNSQTNQCESFIYGGCQGNENRFRQKHECEQACVEKILSPPSVDMKFNKNDCSLPMEQGPCEAYIPSFYFNSELGKCESFIYGGCQGNANRFALKDDCEKNCESTPIRQTKCQLPPETGPCRGYFQKYFFNKITQSCETFIYGGCDGNLNNFDSEDECVTECSSAYTIQSQRKNIDENVCMLPKVSGMCMAHFERYYYNTETGKCEQFVYGGCEANGNNFETMEACALKCENL